jgi:hypothetical protein
MRLSEIIKRIGRHFGYILDASYQVQKRYPDYPFAAYAGYGSLEEAKVGMEKHIKRCPAHEFRIVHKLTLTKVINDQTTYPLSRLFGWSLNVSFDLCLKDYQGCFVLYTDCFTLEDAREMMKEAQRKHPDREFRIDKQVKFTKILK